MADQITQLGLHGPQAAYATFEPKNPGGGTHHAPVTRLTVYAAQLTEFVIYALETEAVTT